MKKVYLAAAATSALAIAATPVMADEHHSMSVYGWVTAEVSEVDGNWDVNSGNGANSETRFGIRASRDLGAGLSADANLEYGAVRGGNGTPGLRHANAALSGDFGTVRVGQQWNPGYLWTTATSDIMLSGAFLGARATDFVFRERGGIFYYTPSLGGLELAFGGNMDGTDDTSDDFDTMTVSARYSFGDLYLSATYMSKDDDDSSDAMSFAASYDLGVVTLVGAIADLDGVGAYSTDRGTPYEVGATFSATDELTLKLAYADLDLDAGSDSSVAVEATYAFGAGVTGFLGYAIPDDNINDGNDILSFGVQVVF